MPRLISASTKSGHRDSARSVLESAASWRPSALLMTARRFRVGAESGAADRILRHSRSASANFPARYAFRANSKPCDRVSETVVIAIGLQHLGFGSGTLQHAPDIDTFATCSR